MILMIDNYDSFTYNLVQYIGSLGVEIDVRRNDKISIDEIRQLCPDKIVISPGPGYPNEAGLSLEIIKQFHNTTPILGVCLGHQCIGESFGGKVVPAKELVHGKASDIIHDGKGIFKDLPNPLNAGRYHSLVVAENTLPSCLEITAKTKDGHLMGIRHKEYPTEGVQFHPESILTDKGIDLMSNFIFGGKND
jgi:para-aminobenzoate synthetase component II